MEPHEIAEKLMKVHPLWKIRGPTSLHAAFDEPHVKKPAERLFEELRRALHTLAYAHFNVATEKDFYPDIRVFGAGAIFSGPKELVGRIADELRKRKALKE